MARSPDPNPTRWPDDVDPVAAVLELRSFPAIADQVPATRLLTRDALSRHPQFNGWVVELLVTELVTNSVVHSGSPDASLVIVRTRGGNLRVAVTDHPKTARIPHMRERSLTDKGGRGLLLVSRSATLWGITHDDVHRCVTVWFEVGEDQGDAAWADETAPSVPAIVAVRDAGGLHVNHPAQCGEVGHVGGIGQRP